MKMAVGTKCFLKLGDKLVGECFFDDQSTEEFFRYNKEWEKEGFPLSPTLPFGQEISKSVFLAFLENMLPEGRALEHLSRLNNISKNNVLALCLAIRNDLAGALFLTMGDEEQQASSSFRPLKSEEILQRLETPEVYPMDVWDGRPRLSVAGMQTKLNVFKQQDQFGLVDGKDLSSTHILKFEGSRHPHLLLNEHLTMTLAKSLGVPVAQTTLKRLGSHRVLEVERFDRKLVTTANGCRVMRRHIIDACQALGLPSSFKYEQNYGNGRDVAHIRDGVSIEKLFSMIAFAADPSKMQRNLLLWVLFNLIVGNSDAHGKNFSFFVQKSGLAPTPWYDLVSVFQIAGFEHAMAMSFDGEFELAQIHALQLLYEFEKCSVDLETVEETMNWLVSTLEVALEQLQPPDDCDDKELIFCKSYKEAIDSQLQKWSKELVLMPKLRADSTLF